ncbi:LysR family transcriptional regulator [Clostridium sp. PL3]|uniref:LysR family transcriptional regulator n=1 Tax=Clostridium thailandense TaxID=2794346 RepID=A0A949U5I9_9CLOT|nr:LysR family transcriptional regulator [Clostridium thailandense]MBV7276854.1 LysR family transcriptional regulator [Clostridium thailandense]
METQHIREFIDLGYTLNYRQTAERLFISQPTLSKHITKMEQELGVQLFIRTKQFVRLTTCGEQFYEKAKKIVTIYDEVTNKILCSRKNMEGTLRVGYLDNAIRHELVSGIEDFKAKYPNITLSLISSKNPGEIEHAIKDDAMDIALTLSFSNTVFPPEWYFEEIKPDILAAVVSKSNLLSEKSKVDFSELLEYPLLFPNATAFTDYSKCLRNFVKNSNRSANEIYEFSDIDTALIMVESGIGVTVMPKHIKCRAHSAKFIDLNDSNAIFSIGALRKITNCTPGSKEFIETLLLKYQDQNNY